MPREIIFSSEKHDRSQTKKTKMKIFSRLTILLTLVMLSTSMIFAQEDLNAAGSVFNEGNEALKAKNFDVAITKYEEALGMCKIIGMDAYNLKANIEKQLPQAQYYYGLDLVKNKKVTQGLDLLKEALKNAKPVNDQKVIDGSNKYIATILGSMGYQKTKKEDFENAISTFDEALSYNPRAGKVYLYKGMTYKEMNDDKNMDESLLNAIKYAREENDEKTAMNAIKIGRSFYVGKIQSAIEAKNYSDAITQGEHVLKYDDKYGPAYYFMAVAYNNLSQYDNALTAATQALGFSDSAQETQAGIHLEMGKAHEGNGNTTAACEEYNQAAFGNFKAEAEYKVKEVLKCQ
ncbi:MAG: tetratricopeptide repeat protein [Bacteroidia bacterium]|nr:tetratricopeptide repeat protein [Bacteroidia bacterium]